MSRYLDPKADYEKGKADERIEVSKEMARKQLKRGVSIDIIIEDTGLTYEGVEAIKNELDLS